MFVFGLAFSLCVLVSAINATTPSYQAISLNSIPLSLQKYFTSHGLTSGRNIFLAYPQGAYGGGQQFLTSGSYLQPFSSGALVAQPVATGALVAQPVATGALVAQPVATGALVAQPPPNNVVVQAPVQPVNVQYQSQSVPLNVQHTHIRAPKPELQLSRTEEDPHILVHEVVRPVVQEVREIIQPYRRIIQEIRPVQEEVVSQVASSKNHHGHLIAAAPTTYVKPAPAILTPNKAASS